MTRNEMLDKIEEFLHTHFENVECDCCLDGAEDLQALIEELRDDNLHDNPWHKNIDGDLPKKDGRYLVMAQNGYCHTSKYDADSRYWDTIGYQSDIKYWMEIPKPHEEK